MTDKEKRLMKILARISYHYSSTPSFRLASGKLSNFYIDCKTTTLTPEGLTLTGEVIFERIKDLPIQAIGGLEFGAIPLALAASMHAFKNGMEIKPFVVRKQPKGSGLKKAIEGKILPGERVVVVEDVITTGASSLTAIERLKEAQIVVDHVLAMIDRNEGGKEALDKAGYRLDRIFGLDDLHNALSEN